MRGIPCSGYSSAKKREKENIDPHVRNILKKGKKENNFEKENKKKKREASPQ